MDPSRAWPGGSTDESTDEALNMTFDKCELIGHDSKLTRPNLMVVSVAVPETIGGMLEADR